jgi:hypothetical protein
MLVRVAKWQLVRALRVGRGVMPVRAHIADLEELHRMLETELASAHAHVSIDHLEIAELKRRKLLVKNKLRS